MVTVDRINSDYTVYLFNGKYYGQCNKCGGSHADPNVTKATVQQAVVNLLPNGGTIHLKQNTLDSTVWSNLPDNIIVIEDYQGDRKVYSKLGRNLPFPKLTSDPTTAGWGATQEARAWYNATSHLFKFWDASQIQTLINSKNAPDLDFATGKRPKADFILLNPSDVPDSPQEGMLYYKTGQKLTKIYDGSSWLNFILSNCTTGVQTISSHLALAAGKYLILDILNWNPTSEPESPTEGYTYYDSSAKKLKLYDGSEWLVIPSVGGGSESYILEPKYTIFLDGSIWRGMRDDGYVSESNSDPLTVINNVLENRLTAGRAYFQMVTVKGNV